MIFCGLLVMLRHSAGRSIGHRVPFGFVLFTAILAFLVYRFMFVISESRRRPVSRAITELSKGDGDNTKSA